MSVTLVTRQVSCRACGTGPMEEVFRLGLQYVIGFPPVELDLSCQDQAPLTLVKCPSCQLVQLSHTVAPDRLFRSFWYRSGVNEQMHRSLQDVVAKACAFVSLRHGDAVLDIGCNDGTLLSCYDSPAVFRVGVDPASSLVNEGLAAKRIDAAVGEFFSYNALARSPMLRYDLSRGFHVITAISMFYDLADPASFLADIRACLARDGVFIVQMNYLVSMLTGVAFDNICHEHLAYYSLASLKWLVDRAGLEIVDVETNDTNGGSFRAYITHRSEYRVSHRVAEMLDSEHRLALNTPVPYAEFDTKVQQVVQQLNTLLKAVEAKYQAPVAVYGASTRGCVLLQACSEAHSIVVAADRDPVKFHRYMAGTRIRIDSEDLVRKYAKVFLLLPWHFWPSIQVREHAWMAAGGKFIVPLPEPAVYTVENGELVQTTV